MGWLACHDACVLCGEQRGKHLLDYSIRGQPRMLIRCRCGLVRVDPIPTPEQILSFHDPETWWFEEDDVRIPVFDEVLDAAGRHRQSGRFLDVGCGAGTLLDRSRSRGYEVIGVELSRDACRRARGRYGVEARPGSVRDQRFPDGSFDAINALEVIYYPENPIEELREYRRIASRDAVLVLGLRCNRWAWIFSVCNALHRLRFGRNMRLTHSLVSNFLSSWGTFTGNYQLTTRTTKQMLASAGWRVCEVRNQRAGWSGPANVGLRSQLFAAYRVLCNVVERLTGGKVSIGPNIVVVAQPGGSLVIDEGPPTPGECR